MPATRNARRTARGAASRPSVLRVSIAATRFFKETDIYKDILPNLHFAVLEGPTRITRGLAGAPALPLGRTETTEHESEARREEHMVPYLNDREAWRRQGEGYLRKVRSRPPVFVTGARRAARGVRPAA